MNQLKYSILLFILPFFTWAQQVETTVDRTEIAIGEAINYQVKVMTDSSDVVTFPAVKTMGELEVIDAFPVDTLKVKAKYQLIKKYNLTQFDSGHYVLPRQIVKINRKEYYTDSLAVHVKDIPVDTTNIKIYDIKTVLKATGKPERFSFKPWLWLLVLIPFLALLAAWYFKRKKNVAAKAIKKRLPPLQEAKLGFKTLDKSGLDKQEDVKEYYTKLTDIVRTYIGRDVAIPSLETTTKELVRILKDTNHKKKLGISKETIANVEAVLSRADLIKFAKFKPLPNEIALDRKTAENCVLEIETEIHRPVLNEEGVDVELIKKQAVIRKAKNKKIAKWALGLGLVLVLLGGLVYKYGFSYLKDKTLGNSTLELLETKEWIASEYGYPPVQVETPKLLIYKEQDFPDMLKQAMDEISSFQYGGISDKFAVILTTATTKQKAPEYVTSEAIGKVFIDLLMKKGLSPVGDITSEEVERNGKTCALSTVQLQYKVPDTAEKIILKLKGISYADDAGLQNLMSIYLADDSYGEKVADRIITSFMPLSGKFIKAKEEDDDNE